MRCPIKNEIATSPTEIFNIFNKHFSYIGEKLAAKLPNSSKHFSYYLNTNNYRNSFFFKPVTSSEVESEINSMPCGKTNSLYSCPMCILKCIKENILWPLAEIMNLSIQNGVFPSKLKHAKVIPVYKDDDETDPGNYRPISLLSNFSKIFEKFMYKRLKHFFDKNQILYDKQYGLETNTRHNMQLQTL